MSEITDLSDEQIAVLVRGGETGRYAIIIRRYQEKLMRYANYLTGNDDEAADVVQNAFIKAYVNLNSFDAKKKFSSWLYRIVHNEAINIINKNKKQTPIADMDFDSGINLEEEIIDREKVAGVRNCLDKMQVIYSEPLALFYLEDKSYEEISDILRIPVSTVGTRISRAKIIMKKICKKLS